jgi:hypothetical protein
MIALATRGYLWPLHLTHMICGGPKISGTEVLVPEVLGAAVSMAPGPEITGSVVPGPTISGTQSAIDNELEPPYISGSGVPKIR